jgi:hypothetical protein
MFNHNAYFDILGDNLVFSRNVVCDACSRRAVALARSPRTTS